MTINLDEGQLHDLAKLMGLATEQCKWKFYTLAQQGMRRTHEGNAVENALRGAMHWNETFRMMLKQEREANKEEETSK